MNLIASTLSDVPFQMGEMIWLLWPEAAAVMTNRRSDCRLGKWKQFSGMGIVIGAAMKLHQDPNNLSKAPSILFAADEGRAEEVCAHVVGAGLVPLDYEGPLPDCPIIAIPIPATGAFIAEVIRRLC